ncbi:helix-turn-helix domain-containing protein [Nitratireductor sp. ZSWI3]|uniref:helix-turn-helix domain-containing protein n=1 Tax=Nitratireductor sp. ZSWI3 TaxID=2966359 RepID=UPI00214FB8F3|nr:XRE family transcriptional regulator [Nitratireductor sp. ZSWI3]MCR4269121.1 XRE family transcriptional regulator [Nitratireductor sp. ZSWI3]
MGNLDEAALDTRIAQRLRSMRAERGWSLEALAQTSGVSRATLSRLENAEVSPTAAVLGKLCTAYGMTLSRLLYLVEDEYPAVVRRDAQSLWVDPQSGFRRRAVSPPAPALAGEVLEGALPPGARLAYEGPPRPGLEHHLVLLEGRLTMSVGGAEHRLLPGDCLRYQLRGPNSFSTPPDSGARYLLFVV